MRIRKLLTNPIPQRQLNTQSRIARLATKRLGRWGLYTAVALPVLGAWVYCSGELERFDREFALRCRDQGMSEEQIESKLFWRRANRRPD